ncbi:MAG: hypothetical protein LBB05_04240 [Puniceicoccales bacterium]|jgi:lipopolysaccharide biosynthesis glycosyltransferase|nr:hypothetical protein [Puniceicoccales bacterium]
MKKVLKFNIRIRFVLAILLCSPFKTYASADEARVFVFACNDPYAGPTAVAIQSLKETNRYEKEIVIFLYKVEEENVLKLGNMGDEYSTIYTIDLCEEKWKTMPTFGGQTIDLVESIMQIGRGKWDEMEFLNSQYSKDTLYRFMINLRLFFPDIWASGLLPLRLSNIEYFLWLDSDIIIYKDLSNIFEMCKRRPNQPIFGANLLYSNQDDYSDQGDLYSGQDEFEDHTYSDENCCISGGVVLWNIEKIVEHCILICQNVFKKTNFETNSSDDDSGNEEQKAYIIYDSEEHIFTEYVSIFLVENVHPETPQGFLPIQYNVTNDCYRYINEEDIFIFHWDGIKKPWKDTDEKEDSDFIKKQNAQWKKIAARTPFYSSCEE